MNLMNLKLEVFVFKLKNPLQTNTSIFFSLTQLILTFCSQEKVTRGHRLEDHKTFFKLSF